MPVTIRRHPAVSFVAGICAVEAVAAGILFPLSNAPVTGLSLGGGLVCLMGGVVSGCSALKRLTILPDRLAPATAVSGALCGTGVVAACSGHFALGAYFLIAAVVAWVFLTRETVQQMCTVMTVTTRSRGESDASCPPGVTEVISFGVDGHETYDIVENGHAVDWASLVKKSHEEN